MPQKFEFGPDFTLGAATSAYQIEGAATADQKGESNWDRFMPYGDRGCDHYHRYLEDIKIMAGLNLDSYRFSLSWPRLFPNGRGELNEYGIDFYNNLIDQLLAHNIEPMITLYHWELPWALEKEGGWESRATALAFADYAAKMVEIYGDRVQKWVTLNEPLSVAVAGYMAGEHAPGKKGLLKGLRACHNQLLAHGLAFRKMKAVRSDIQIGLANALFPVIPHRPQDKRIAKRIDTFVNKAFMDPIFKGSYPGGIRQLMHLLNWQIKKRDLDIIKTPLDFIGVNHYARFIVRKTWLPFIGFKFVKAAYEGVKFTDMDWEIFPDSFSEVLRWVKTEYNNPPIYITENGAAFKDIPTNGQIKDEQRQNFLKESLVRVKMALDRGINIKGYYVWSLLDNFEWSYGYSKRFGIVYVDYETKERIIKQSGHWYGRFCKKRVLTRGKEE